MEIKGDLALVFAGGQVPVEKCNIAITQPALKEICAFGEDNFFLKILCCFLWFFVVELIFIL